MAMKVGMAHTSILPVRCEVAPQGRPCRYCQMLPFHRLGNSGHSRYPAGSEYLLVAVVRKAEPRPQNRPFGRHRIPLME